MTTDNLAARSGGGGNQGRTILLVGLALGVITAVVIALALRDNGGDTGTRIVPATRLAVVARADIPARTRLTREQLEVKTYDIGAIDSDAFSSVNQVLNRVTATDIKAGAAIVPALVSTTAGEGLSFTVEEGKRAISIGVSEVVIAGGNLTPGSRVDVLAAVDVGVGGAIKAGDVTAFVAQLTGVQPRSPVIAPEGSRLTFTIVQDVRVLAVAQTLPPEAVAPSGSQPQQQQTQFTDTANTKAAAPNPGAGTVTVEVTPQQAQVMVTADLTATLRLAVRAFGDSAASETNPIIIQLR
jgi:Flp pilus assembly protein CpaB